MKSKKGISLIVLIITIIVVIILAAAVILTITKNNPVDSAKEATFKEDVKAFQDDLALTVAKEYTNKQGQRDTKINATDVALFSKERTDLNGDGTFDDHDVAVFKTFLRKTVSYTQLTL